MQKILKIILLLSYVSAALGWDDLDWGDDPFYDSSPLAWDDDDLAWDAGNQEVKKETPEEEEVQPSENDPVSQVKNKIQERCELYKTKIANVEDGTVKAAHLVALLMDLEDILQQAFKTWSTLHPGGMHAFLKEVFGEIGCQYDGRNFMVYLAEALKALGHVTGDAIKDLMRVTSNSSELSLPSALHIQQTLQNLQNNQHLLVEYESLGFYITLCMETMSQEKLFKLLKTPDVNNNMILHMLCLRGHTGLIQILFNGEFLTKDQSMELLKTPDFNLENLLHLVCRRGYTDTLKTLLNLLTVEDWMELLRMKDRLGFTPLHWACEAYRTEIFTLLREHCEKDPAFRAMLKKLLNEMQRPLTVDNPKHAAQKALEALLEVLSMPNPDDTCDVTQYSPWGDDDDDDDDDDSQGGSDSDNGFANHGWPVITITLPTLATSNAVTEHTSNGRHCTTQNISF